MIKRLMRLVATVLAMGMLAVGVIAVATPVPAEAGGLIDRWNRTTVYVVNELDPTWPVTVAAGAWDTPSRLDLIVVDRCPVRTPSCIAVRRGRLHAETLGETSTERDDLGRYSRATIMINDQIAPDYDASLKLLLVRHELGHALGFNHTRKDDVMNEKITETGCPLLGYFHIHTLRRLYGPEQPGH